jgi:hypothetical protein
MIGVALAFTMTLVLTLVLALIPAGVVRDATVHALCGTLELVTLAGTLGKLSTRHIRVINKGYLLTCFVSGNSSTNEAIKGVEDFGEVLLVEVMREVTNIQTDHFG